MLMIANIKIGTRLGLAFGVMVVLIVFMVGGGLYKLATIQGQMDHIVKSNSVRIMAANEATAAISLVYRAIDQIVLERKNPAARAELKESIAVYRSKYAAAMKTLEEREKQEKGKVLIEKIKEALLKAKEVNNRVVDLAMNDQNDEAHELMLSRANLLYIPIQRLFDEMNGYQKSRIEARYQEAVSAYESAKIGLLSALLLALVIAVTCSLAVTRSITVPLRSMVSLMQGVAMGEGDLTKRLRISGKDELAEVNTQFNHFVDSLDTLISHAARSAVHVAASASLIQASSQNMSKGVGIATTQATSVATAGEEMSATSCDIAQSCSKVAESSQHTNGLASEGASVIQATVEGMARISERVQSTATVIESLGARSDQIGAIVGTIEDIADQTNLLALNAAIEAARAGEQGRGFAVVADEVRALAERTTRATREIAEMIKVIQKETKSAVAAIEEGVDAVAVGTADAARSGEALHGILHQVNEVTTQIHQIATAAEEQTATTNEISSNIHLITDTFGKAAKISRETSNEAGKLNKLSEELQETVRRFKTKESDVLMLTIAANDHRLFVNKIRAAVIGETPVDAGSLPTHHTCRFGKWYDGDGKGICGHLGTFSGIAAPHERIHSLAKEAVTAVNAGNQSRANSLMQEVEDASRSVMSGLEDVQREYLHRPV